MESTLSAGAPRRAESTVNLWVWILCTALIPLFIGAFFFYKWYSQKTDFTQVTQDFVQRQNTVLAYDAVEVSRKVSDIFQKAVADVKVLALLPREGKTFLAFYRSHQGRIFEVASTGEAGNLKSYPYYNELAYYGLDGEEILRVDEGRVIERGRTFEDCRESILCDRALITQALKMPVGEIWIGDLMRWYTPKGLKEDLDGATWRIAYRAPTGVFVVGVDYKHVRNILYTPSFPYNRKEDLLRAYSEGDYIYIVDHKHNLIHPKYWHNTGIEKTTGVRVPPVEVDAQFGTRSLNVSSYRGARLRDYFERLLGRSFLQKGVDIFQAPNLARTIRVLSVAPILLSEGQFKNTGVFGHVVIGCNVDYFEEPREQMLPYY